MRDNGSKMKTFSELSPLPVSQAQREQRLKEQTCYRLCACRIFRVSCSIRSRIRQRASAMVLWAPLLFNQWLGSLLSCSFVRRTSCFLTKGTKTSQSSFQMIRMCSAWPRCQNVDSIKLFQAKMTAEFWGMGGSRLGRNKIEIRVIFHHSMR